MGPPTSRPSGLGQANTTRDYISVITELLQSLRVLSVNFTYFIVFMQVMLSLQCVRAGPVVFNMEYSQGPVPLARNIRHLPCISRRTAQEGLCMFAIDCLKANGTHLGTCIDRFYFGSCCQIPDKTILPQIIGIHIDDNSIDGANFVHPQTEDKVQSHFTIFPERKTTTEKIESKVTDSIALETKADEQTTIDNKIEEKLTTVELEKVEVTEVPMKLSTFQTVSGEQSTVTEKETKSPEISTTSTVTTSTVTLRPKPTRKPTRPSSFTRPTYKPYNITRPLYTQSTFKPKPTKPALNTTRKPPYRLPPKRPSTKKPLPLPPRLNITILPQSTSSKPLFTRPQSVSITYINYNTTQVSTNDDNGTTTTSTTTTTPTTTTITTTTTTTSTTTTTEKATTEKLADTTELITDTTFLTTEAATEKVEKTTEPLIETTESLKETTFEDVTVKETVKPETEASVPEITTTDYPPFATWSSNIDAVTKTPEKDTEVLTTTTTTTTTTEETWSPITPPEGWILLSTIAPRPEISVSTSTVAPTTEAAMETLQTTQDITEKPTTIVETNAPETTQTTTPVTTPTTRVTTTTTKTTPTSTAKVTTSPTTEATTPTTTTTTEKTTSSTTAVPVTTSTVVEKVPETTQAIQEFTVNVTLSPTVPTTTTSSSITFTLLSTTNDTKGNESSTTESATSAAPETSTNATSIETTTESYNMSDYKNVCGRRLWQAPTGRIVGGAKSGFGMWPWQISLRQYRTSTYLHKCGAALLNENWAITAAHCVEHVPPSELLVRLGEHDLANEDEPYGFAERRVQIVASHPHFDPATFEYDLALLRFYEPVKFQPNILPVCVPDTDEDYVGKTAYVTGWGRLFDEGPLPSVLQEVQVPVINNSACEAMYQAAGYNEHIPNIFICAGRSKGGTDSCEGDSGGPMVLPRERDGRFVLGGVISWGIGCAEPNQPGVYTRISEFRDWINQILQF